ncbi:DUF4038 domain-containing protein [Salmonella enterica]|nr:DUF4038 domain-containing protein [Salmonella enterica]
MCQKINQWQKFEQKFSVTDQSCHFTESWLTGTFSFEGETRTVYGFYNDNGEFVLRFMPDKAGEWSYTLASNLPELNNIRGEFTCIASCDDKGPVRRDGDLHFSHADGTPWYPFGTTAYVWNYQKEEIQKQTYASLSASPFNKIRMCVFPKHYRYNFSEPERFPFPGNIKDGFDYSRFDVEFFKGLEKQIATLAEMNIEVDLIIFHPYDRWGFSAMPPEVDHRYIRYLVARLASFKNIWWSLANEFDLLLEKNMSFWDEAIAQIKREDPSDHLISIHNWHNPPIHYRSNTHWYDHHNPALSHASIQHHDMHFVPEWRESFKKPIVIDECCYEGTVDLGWGNITAQKMVSQFWHGVCLGGYVTHGETYLSDDDIIWWSHGGKLKGESIPRIAFLKQILEEGQAKRLTPLPWDIHWDSSMGLSNNAWGLFYFGEYCPGYKMMTMLEENTQWKVDIIDTWNMTITPVSELIKHGDKLDLPGKPWIALRLQRD